LRVVSDVVFEGAPEEIPEEYSDKFLKNFLIKIPGKVSGFDTREITKRGLKNRLSAVRGTAAE
jgi:hypothetical protein